METVRDGDLEIVMAGPTGFGNNVYVVIGIHRCPRRA